MMSIISDLTCSAIWEMVHCPLWRHMLSLDLPSHNSVLSMSFAMELYLFSLSTSNFVFLLWSCGSFHFPHPISCFCHGVVALFTFHIHFYVFAMELWLFSLSTFNFKFCNAVGGLFTFHLKFCVLPWSCGSLHFPHPILCFAMEL